MCVCVGRKCLLALVSFLPLVVISCSCSFASISAALIQFRYPNSKGFARVLPRIYNSVTIENLSNVDVNINISISIYININIDLNFSCSPSFSFRSAQLRLCVLARKTPASASASASALALASTTTSTVTVNGRVGAPVWQASNKRERE